MFTIFVLVSIALIIPAIGANKSFLFIGTLKYLLIISDNTSSIYRLFRQNQIT